MIAEVNKKITVILSHLCHLYFITVIIKQSLIGKENYVL